MENKYFQGNMLIIWSMKMGSKIYPNSLKDSFCKIHFNKNPSTREVVFLGLRTSNILAQFVSNIFEDTLSQKKKWNIGKYLCIYVSIYIGIFQFTVYNLLK